MMDAIGDAQALGALKAQRTSGRAVAAFWIGVVLVAMVLPWLFYDWAHGRQSGFVISMLSQMGMMVIFALSYNMLMGQSGLLSLCHAVLFGIGGYAMIHCLNAAGDGSLPVPMELMPLLSGFAGLGIAVVFGYMATRQRATAFAMITLGIGQLMTVAAKEVLEHQGGVSTDRTNAQSLFGFSYAHGIAVYYLILAWAVVATLAMLALTFTPLGRMANACRDNHERAQFMGYDPRTVRFLQFALSGFFAGIAGGLYAVTYEIVTFDALAAPLSANALLMAYIGGTTVFAGPILGAVLITLLQSGVSLMSNSWLIYVGVLFIAMVTFAPSGLAGLILAHAPIRRAGRLRRLAMPYLRIALPALATILGFVGIVELASFLTIGEAQGKHLVLFGHAIDVRSPAPWIVSAVLLIAGGLWFLRAARGFRLVWDTLTADLRDAA
jgi:branched-chain amino acid transport system permease protein